MKTRPTPGTEIRETRKHLRASGRVREKPAHFLVQECECGLCRLGEHVATNQASLFGEGWRHVHIGTVELAR